MKSIPVLGVVISGVLAGALLLGGSPAEAQTWARHKGLLGTYSGVQLSLGGGVTRFARDTPRDATNVGGQWEVALGYAPEIADTHLFAFEAAYIGTAQGLTPAGVSNGTLWSHGFEGLVRLQPGFATWMGIEPYVFGGMGATWFSTSVPTGQGSVTVADQNNAHFVVPVGLGVQFRMEGLLIDLRGAYRFRFTNDLIRASGDPDPALDSWSVTGRVGVDL